MAPLAVARAVIVQVVLAADALPVRVSGAGVGVVHATGPGHVAGISGSALGASLLALASAFVAPVGLALIAPVPFVLGAVVLGPLVGVVAVLLVVPFPFSSPVVGGGVVSIAVVV